MIKAGLLWTVGIVALAGRVVSFTVTYAMTPILMMVGAFSWKLVKDHVWAFVDTIANGFGVKLSILSNADREITKFDGTLASVLDLAIGVFVMFWIVAE